MKFRRIALYLLGCICLGLIYQVFIYGSDVVRTQKRSTRNNELSREVPTRIETRRDKHSSDKGVRNLKNNNNNGSRLREGYLRNEIRALRLRLHAKERTIRALRANLAQRELHVTKLENEISQLKSQNDELLAESQNYNKTKSEKMYTDDYKEGSLMNNDKNDIIIPEIVPYSSFGKTHVFESETLPKPKEYMLRSQRRKTVKSGFKHIVEMENLALEMINENGSRRLSMDNIIEGVYRFDINHGVEYEIYFNDSKSKGSVLSARVFRKLSKPQIVLPSLKYKQPNELINLIVPLSGRIERFQQFIDLFIDVCIKRDKHVYLTVVLYGEKDFKIIRRILKDLEDSYNFRKYQLIMRNKQFSRGRALHDGVIYWKGKNPNVLMFFCDVDVTFDEHFLRRCRSYTEPSKQVYYPMVFSLYNPRNVYEDGMIPSPQEQLNIGNQYGYWRIYGYGMTCQYRSDYLRVGGFDLSIRGWGSEDHKLHRMYVAKPEIRIIRAPDRSLFHHYHEKHCDPSLKWEQYRSCLGSKAKTEGTLQQIALQLFKLRDKYNDDTGSDR